MNNDMIERNYQSIIDRGIIKPTTNAYAFIDKMLEEVQELKEAVNICREFNGSNEKMFEDINEELADVILVCYNMARHFNIRIKDELLKKIEINERRADSTDSEDVSDS
jgi:NTP pyrophosphatase (non-canonical NTP hydrolase)